MAYPVVHDYFDFLLLYCGGFKVVTTSLKRKHMWKEQEKKKRFFWKDK